jgi:phenylpropionate dioxygenase-like ring-hydroxylating dioxygenase large terminal subunit
MHFPDFANVWTPVAFTNELRGDGPLGVVVAGTKVVLFRSGGRLAALLDRCPHRGVALSLGRVREGCLECPFHGWRFDADGACAQVPWNPDAKRDPLGATSVPVRELGGLLWIYTRAGADAPTEPSVPAELMGQGVRLSGQAFTWSAHWTRAVENMLDDAHLPFVHPKTIGRSPKPKRESRMDHRVETQPWGWSWTTSIDGELQGQSAEFRWPNTMLLRIPVPGKLLAIHFTAIPVSPTVVRILQLSVRSFLRWRAFDGVFHRINRRVLMEDRLVVESSPSEVPPPREERSVRTDAHALAFRKRYLRELVGVADE